MSPLVAASSARAQWGVMFAMARPSRGTPRHAAVLILLVLALLRALLGEAALGAPAVTFAAPLRFVGAALPPAELTTAVQLVNDRDRSWNYRWTAQLNVVTVPSATLIDALHLTTDCGDCRTVGIAVELNVVKRGQGTVISRGDATSLTGCHFGTCVSMGLVMQYTVIVDDPARALPRMKRLLRRTIALLRGLFPGHRVNVARVLRGFNRLARMLIPHAPIIRLSAPSSSDVAHGPNSPPAVQVALAS